MQSIGQYAGDVDSKAAFDGLAQHPQAILIDVRTTAEWTFVGVPDLRPINKEPLFVEWQEFPSSGPVPGFAEKVVGLLRDAGCSTGSPVYFLCRSGARSRSAAMTLTQSGFTQCFNVADGFEGPLDADNHRGTQSGWKAAGLPWVQG